MHGSCFSRPTRKRILKNHKVAVSDVRRKTRGSLSLMFITNHPSGPGRGSTQFPFSFFPALNNYRPEQNLFGCSLCSIIDEPFIETFLLG